MGREQVADFELQKTSKAGFIRSYGMFWREEEIDWYGNNSERHLELLGRVKHQGSSLRVANFWEQQGIYLLYNDYGPYYVGQTRGEHMNLGKRLRQHAMGLNGSPHKGKWDRFSWFGWRGVLDGTDRRGLRTLRKMPQRLLTDSSKSVNDIESLLIHCLGTTHLGGNGREETFTAALRWMQVGQDSRSAYLSKVQP